MNWKAMADKAKQTFQQRGGSTAAKQDAEELRDIAQGKGSLADKAKEAAAAVREPGAHHPDPLTCNLRAGVRHLGQTECRAIPVPPSRLATAPWPFGRTSRSALWWSSTLEALEAV
jgi:hypothetical protein